jgi:putative addiction module killer protein
MRYHLLKTPEYQEWFEEEPAKSKVQIAERLERIESDGHFGIHKEVGDVSELKWGNGRRVYYVIIPPHNVILLLGGNKNGQDKDIKKAEKIFRKYC